MSPRSSGTPGDDVRRSALRDFRRIPGVGPSIAVDLWDLGYRSVEELRGHDPEAMYERFNDLRGMVVDRCMLYVLRCGVYFASHDHHDPELLKWWSWKDGGVAYTSETAGASVNPEG
jgi:hypothetical protein